MAGDHIIKARWAELGQMDRAALRVSWAEVFGEAPPHFLSMIFIRKALIWHEQCRRSGGLRPDVRRSLKSAADGKSPRSATAAGVRPGTQLIREWNGRRCQVDVTDDGYRFNGERWQRQFGHHEFRSHLAETPQGMTERFGPFTFLLGLEVKDDALHYAVRAARLGPLPLPRWLLPISVAREYVSEGRFRFDVAIYAPLTKSLVVHYKGWLRRVEAEPIQSR